MQLLNDRQEEAVHYTEGPLLILAGAGSGKTRVLTHRIAYLIGEKGVPPYNIMAITFTNKAADEMRQRVDRVIEHGAEQVWVATFHSSCVRILRRHIDRLGYDNNFTIYDSDDQKTLMKNVLKRLNIDTSTLKEKSALAAISSCKEELTGPEEYAKTAYDYRSQLISKAYFEYEKELHKNNALDFDDLIVKTIELFETEPDVLAYYQNRFRYIMVDEYQDTNNSQFRLVELLAGGYRNICVVGDDDQSIYKFRGANIKNILSFEEAFAGAKVIKLEQNYRSTGNILDAANAVIAHNRGRKDKTLWTERESGRKIGLYQYESAPEEADAVARDIRDRAAGGDYGKFAVLYRTNAQSRLLEERFVRLGIPYQLIGGVNFYQRKEIKDIIAYLKIIAGGRDDLSFTRVINVPKRGIGGTTVDKLAVYAAANGLTLYAAASRAGQIQGLGKAAGKIGEFTDLIEDYKKQLSAGVSLESVIDSLVEDTGYREELEKEGEVEAETRLDNIAELKSKAASFEREFDPNDENYSMVGLLDAFLEEVALIADVDSYDEEQSRVTLMTLHGAKGLEFPEVYITGMEEGLFPSQMSINSDDKDEVEEERRLAYVGITRAQDRLTLTFARSRMINGSTMWSRASRFVGEIPDRLLDKHVLEKNYIDRDFMDDDEPDFFGTGGFGSGRGAGRNGGYGSRNSDRSDTGFGYGDAGYSYNAYGPGGSIGGYGSAGYTYGDSKKKKKAPAKKPEKPIALTQGREIAAAGRTGIDYGPGDRVRHIKFGEGTVIEVNEGTRDYEVTVEFDSVGRRTLLAGFAKLIRV